MLMSAFLSVIGLSVGAMSAMFFAAGALFVSTKDLYEITSGEWDVERHVWGDSIADQRADYIVGALLLLVSFGLQLAATLIPSCEQSLPFQPLGYAIAEIVAVLVLVLGCSLFFRVSHARSTKKQLRTMRAEAMAKIEQIGQQS